MNLYAYVVGNPVNMIDPMGQVNQSRHLRNFPILRY